MKQKYYNQGIAAIAAIIIGLIVGAAIVVGIVATQRKASVTQEPLFVPGDEIVEEKEEPISTISSCLPSDPPSIEVNTFSTGGYHGARAIGDQIPIKWKTCNIPNQFNISIGFIEDISLWNSQHITYVVGGPFSSTPTLNDGTEIITIPVHPNPSQGTSKARVYVSTVLPSGNILSDDSEGNIEIDW